MRTLERNLVEALFFEAEIGIKQANNRNLFDGLSWRCVVSIPNPIQFNRVISCCSQQGDKRFPVLAVRHLPRSIKFVLWRFLVFDFRPSAVLKYRMGKITTASRTGTDVLNFRTAEVLFDCCVSLS